jgi:hypothetical protein
MWTGWKPEDGMYTTILYRRSVWWRMLGRLMMVKARSRSMEVGLMDVALMEGVRDRKQRIEFFNREV